jgi:hypothetical protein
MKKNPSLSQIFKPVGAFIKRFHFILFFIALSAGFAYGVLTLNSILATSSNTNGYTSSLTVNTFDQSSIGELNTLKQSTDPTIDTTLPPGRINPFTE